MCVLVVVSLSPSLSSSREKRSKKIVGEVVRLRHVQGQRSTVLSAAEPPRPLITKVAQNVSDGANDVTCHRDCHFLLHNTNSQVRFMLGCVQSSRVECEMKQDERKNRIKEEK